MPSNEQRSYEDTMALHITSIGVVAGSAHPLLSTLHLTAAWTVMPLHADL